MLNIQKIIGFIRYYFVFIITWLLLSSIFDLTLFIIANFCFILFYYFFSKIKLFSKTNKFMSFAFFKYLSSLFLAVLESSKECVNIIFDEKNIDKSDIKKINVSELNQEERVLFSNMITMTPGTFVISINHEAYYIHTINGTDFDKKFNIEKIKELVMNTRKDSFLNDRK